MKITKPEEIDTGRPSGQGWEYTTLSGDPGTLDARLNQLGNQGWEAIDSHMSGGIVYILLKRRR